MKIDRLAVFNKYEGKCAYSGKDLDFKTFEIDHINPKYKIGEYDNSFDNLLPTFKEINFYKNARDLEEFRKFMYGFHLRYAKLPKKTKVERTKNRILFMNKIAKHFDSKRQYVGIISCYMMFIIVAIFFNYLYTFL